MPDFSLTIDVEEWYDTLWFKPDEIFSKHYGGVRPRTHIEDDVNTILGLLDAVRIKSTFFVLGRVASEYPSIIPAILDQGHEVASHGFSHVKPQSSQAFDQDITSAINILRQQGAEVNGYRAPNLQVERHHLPRLMVQGFTYDSSVMPSIPIPNWYGSLSSLARPHVIVRWEGKALVEVPIAVFPLLRLPLGNSWTYRNLPRPAVEAGLQAALNRFGSVVVYLHAWEFSNDLPTYPEIPWHVFRNCGRPLCERVKSTARRLEKICTFVPARELAKRAHNVAAIDM